MSDGNLWCFDMRVKSNWKKEQYNKATISVKAVAWHNGDTSLAAVRYVNAVMNGWDVWRATGYSCWSGFAKTG